MLLIQNNNPQIPLCKIEGYVNKGVKLSPNYISKHELIDYLQWNFDLLLQQDHVLRDILLAVRNLSGSAVVFGGWVRDHISAHQTHRKPRPRDLDIVVNGLSFTQLKRLLPLKTEVNLFGGFSTLTTANKLDIWLLENTYLIARMELPVTFETLPGTTVFRLNSIVFQPQPLWTEASLLDLGCIEAISKKVVDFQSALIPLPCVQVARALIYSAKLEFRLDSKIIAFIQSVCSDQAIVDQVKQGLASYCTGTVLSDAFHLFDSIVDPKVM